VALALGQCQEATGLAIAVLRRIMLSDKASPSSRVAAAKAIMDIALTGLAQQDFQAQLHVLEQQIGVLRHASPHAALNGHVAAAPDGLG
jgi:hypothetical protein